MPEDAIHTDDPRIPEIIETLHDVWPERLSRRDEAQVRRTLAAGLPEAGGPGLSTAEGRRSLTRTVWSATDVRDGAPLRASSVAAVAVKLTLEIHDFAAGCELSAPTGALPNAPGAVSVHGAASPSDVRPGPASTRAGFTGPDRSVEFAFPWRPAPVGTRQRLGTATSHVRVTTIDPADAPVTCSLWTPEGHLDVRRHGDTWLRPVLSPGSWAPIGSDRFAEAAASGEAWRDSPFLSHTGRGRPTFHLRDYASARAMAKGDDRRIAVAGDACLARAGWLCAIDGVVHRTTVEPLAGVVTLITGDALEIGPVWSLGDLDSTCVMDTISCFEGVVTQWAFGRVRPDPSARSVDRRGFVPVAEWESVAAGTPAWSPVSVGGASGRWPTSQGLLRLGDGAPEPSNADVVLRAAAATSAVALTPMQSRDALRGYGCEFGDLHVLLRTLCEPDLDPHLRRVALSAVEPSCEVVVNTLPFVPAQVRLLWAYVVALARHCVSCEAGRTDEVEDFTTLRL